MKVLLGPGDLFTMQLVFVVLFSSAAAVPLTKEYVEANSEEMWLAFKLEHDRNWGEDDEFRFSIFKKNMFAAAKLQRTNSLASFGPTSMADLTDQEYNKYLGIREDELILPKEGAPFTAEEATRAAAGSIDWREHGAVSPVRDQGKCGACWAFSAMGGIEGQWAAAGHPLVPLSPQELVDCDSVDSGCFGGLIRRGLQWILDNRGGKAVTWDSYPYTRHDSDYPPHGNCSDSGDTVGATISGIRGLPSDEAQMAAWVQAHGPLSVAVDASGAWRHYTGGIMTDCACFGPPPSPCSLTHSVLIVGYGTDSATGTDYWILKNSYGKSWGESGFIRMQRGVNMCLVKNTPFSSIVASPSTTLSSFVV